MYKSTLIAVLGLVAVANAHVMEIPMENYAAASPKESFLKLMVHNQNLQSTASSVTWGECDSQKIYYSAVGVNDPEPPQVGKNVNLNLDVIFSSDATVQGVFVNVQFTAKGTSSAITLFAQDYSASGSFHDGDEFTDTVAWLIPGFAPLGHYAVTISVHGASMSADKYACLSADFNIL